MNYDTKLLNELQKYIVDVQNRQYTDIFPVSSIKLIHDNYCFAYNIAIELSLQLESIGIKLDDANLLYYTTLYIQAMVTQNKENKKIKVLLISSFGSPFFTYMSVWLEAAYNENLCIEGCSILQFWDLNNGYCLNEYDLIITSISNLEIANEYVYRLNTLPTELDKIKIDKIIQKIVKKY